MAAEVTSAHAHQPAAVARGSGWDVRDPAAANGSSSAHPSKRSSHGATGLSEHKQLPAVSSKRSDGGHTAKSQEVKNRQTAAVHEDYQGRTLEGVRNIFDKL
jgi:hypothetical protein